MNHEDIKILISAYIDGEVTAAEKDIVEDHLTACAECQKEFAQFQKISSSLKRWPQERLSPDVEGNIKTRLGSIKEGTMNKKETSIQWGAVSIVTIIMVVSVWGVHYYRVRDFNARMGTKSMYTLSKARVEAEPYLPFAAIAEKAKQEKGNMQVARLKSASDDIGDQYTVGNTGSLQAQDMSAPREMNALVKSDEGKSTASAPADQYEPYYLSSNYAVDREVKEVDKVLRQDFSRPEAERLAAAPAAVGGLYVMESSRVSAPAKKFEFRAEEDARYYEGYSQVYYPVIPAQSESYDRIYENAFLNPVNAPLSTFSIDVDTASYSNVRRFLNQGQLPPADAVRVEELVNYFSYDYPDPMWGQPFSITTEVAPCPWNPSHQLALIGLQGKRLGAMSMPASNLVFLVDVSGSMNQPNKLPLLQDAFRMMTRELEGKDKVSIVVYAGAAGLVLDATPGNYKERIMGAIDRLQAGGSTAGGDGIRLAYQVARDHLIPNGNNRVILATDGDFNVGISNDDDLVRMIESYRDQGVFLTVLGFGVGNYKDSKMEKLADHGNGNYFYIDSQQEARKVLVNELGSTLFAIAKDVKIQVEFNPATVREYRLIGYENRMLAKEDFNNDAKDAGELGAGHTVTALYEIVPTQGIIANSSVDPLRYQKDPQIIRGGSSDVMTVKLRYKDPKGTASKLITKTVSQRDVHAHIQSDNLRFASAVAEFGLILRNSPYRGQASFDQVLNRARSSQQDTFGYRAEFVGLVEQARSLSPYITPMPMPEPLIYQSDHQERSNGKGQK